MPDHVDPIEIFPGWPRVGGGSGDGPAASGGDAPAPAAGEGGAGEPEAPIDLAQAAADFEAEALASLPPEGSEAEDGSGKGKAPGSTPASADPLTEHVQRYYGGDKAAFLASLEASRTEARRLADEVAVLKASRQPETRDVQAEFKAERDADTEVQAIDQEIKVIDSKVSAVSARQVEIVNLATKLSNEKTQLEATLPHIEDQKEWAKSYARLSSVLVDLQGLNAEFNTNEARKEQFGLRKSQAQRELVRAENDIKRSMIDREEQQRMEVTNGQRTRQAFGAAFDAAVKEYGLEPTSDTYLYLRDASRTQLADYLDSLGEDSDGLDAAGIFEAVGKLVSAGAKAFKLQPKAPTPAKPRAPITPRPILTPRAPIRTSADEPPVRQPARPRNSDELMSDPDFVRRRAEKVFEASGREALRRNRTGLG